MLSLSRRLGCIVPARSFSVIVAKGAALMQRTNSEHSPTNNSYFSDSLFSALPFPVVLQKRLQALGFSRPSHLQSQALPKVLSGASTIIGGETGSGKTMAYLLPIAAASDTRGALPPRLSAAILVPSQELCVQVAAVLALLVDSRSCRIVSAATAKAANSAAEQCARVLRKHEAVDVVLVATPVALLRTMQHPSLCSNSSNTPSSGVSGSSPFVTSSSTWPTPPSIVVLDEADLLLNATHRAVVEQAMTAIGAAFAPGHNVPTDMAMTVLNASKVVAVRMPGKAAPVQSGATVTSVQPSRTKAELASSSANSSSFSLNPAVQIVACAATLVEPGTSLGARGGHISAEGFGAWLHRHLRHAQYVRSSGLHSPPPTASIASVIVDDSVTFVEQTPPSSSSAADGGELPVDDALPLLDGGATVGFERKMDALFGALRRAGSMNARLRASVAAHAFSGVENGETVLTMSLKARAASSEPAPASTPAAAAPSRDPTAGFDGPSAQVLVFVNEFASAELVAEALVHAAPTLAVGCLHKHLPPERRRRLVLDWFEGRLDVVVATDLAARGLDTTHVSCVVNLDLPADAAAYLHRVGRTARAGEAGTVVDIVFSSQMNFYDRLRKSITRGSLPDSLEQRRNAASKASRLARGGDASSRPHATQQRSGPRPDERPPSSAGGGPSATSFRRSSSLRHSGSGGSGDVIAGSNRR